MKGSLGNSNGYSNESLQNPFLKPLFLRVGRRFLKYFYNENCIYIVHWKVLWGTQMVLWYQCENLILEPLFLSVH